MAISRVSKIVNASLLGMVLATGSLGMAIPAQAATSSNKVINPLVPETYRYSSEAGPRCIPVLYGSTYHLGQDLATSDGNSIRAIADGIVTFVKDPAGSGAGYLAIKHVIDGETVYSGYYHMWKASKYVKVGQKVKQGERVALVGSSGPSTAPHLHFEIWKGGFYGSGYSIDPIKYMKSKGVDIKDDAYLVYKFNTPTSCNYYASTKVTLRSEPTANSKALKTVYQNNLMVSKPGTLVNSHVPVTVNGVSGWVHRSVVSPRKVAQTQPDGGIDLPSTDDKPTTNVTKNVNYEATGNVNMRSGANTTYNVLKVLVKGEKVTTVGKKSGTWLQVKAGITTGWVSESYLKKVTATTPAKPAPTKPSPAKPTPPVVAKTTTYTAVDTVNVREKATTSSNKVGLLQKSKTVEVYSSTNGWAKVSFNKKTAYVSSTYLLKGKLGNVSPVKPNVPNTVTYKATVDVNVREQSNASSKKAGLLTKGKAVEVSSIKNGWAKVSFNKKTAYVSAKYLTKVVAAKPPVTNSKTKTVTSNLNMRSKADMKGTVVTILPKNAKVTVSKTSGAWSQVTYSKKTGWVVSSYLK